MDVQVHGSILVAIKPNALVSVLIIYFLTKIFIIPHGVLAGKHPVVDVCENTTVLVVSVQTEIVLGCRKGRVCRTVDTAIIIIINSNNSN